MSAHARSSRVFLLLQIVRAIAPRSQRVLVNGIESCVGWAILFIILTSRGFAATPNLGNSTPKLPISANDRKECDKYDPERTGLIVAKDP
jgi:hypothetical protein